MCEERTLWFGAIAAFAAAALGVAPPEPAPAAEPAPAVLAGPSVEESEAPTTLVRLGYDGALERLDVPAEEAALELLDLSDEVRASTERILAERAAILDRIVVDNIDQLVEIFTAVQSGDRGAALREYLQFSRELEPLRARGTLAEELASAMPADAAATFTALVEEYREAALEELQRQAREQGRRLARRQAAMQEGIRAVGLEIRRSYERTIGGGQERLGELYATVNATPEQQARISDLAVTFFDRTKGKASRTEKVGLFLAILQELTPEQRSILIESRRGGER